MRRLRTSILESSFPVIFRRDSLCVSLERLGSPYGGWWVPAEVLDRDSVCYLAGVGTDMTFDRAMSDRFGCRMWGLDPTPRSVAWVATQSLPARYVFLPLGLAGEPGVMRFYAPRDSAHVSHSITNLQGTDTYFEAECTTVHLLMKRLRHDRIDLLKMDVEGAQHEIIGSLLRERIFPTVLCVEFDQPEPLSRTRSTLRALRAAEYELVQVEGFNMTLVRRRGAEDR